MIVKTTRSDTVVYHQTNDDSKHLNAVIAHLMQQPTGDKLLTIVSNNGHDMTFRNEEFPIEGLVRKVNGIVSRETRKGAA